SLQTWIADKLPLVRLTWKLLNIEKRNCFLSSGFSSVLEGSRKIPPMLGSWMIWVRNPVISKILERYNRPLDRLQRLQLDFVIFELRYPETDSTRHVKQGSQKDASCVEGGHSSGVGFVGNKLLKYIATAFDDPFERRHYIRFDWHRFVATMVRWVGLK